MSLKINPKIFRGFSVRGIVGVDFDADSMQPIGQATGEWFYRKNLSRIVVGHDVRISSPDLHRHFYTGLIKAGINVIDVGLVPTPVLNFAVDNFRADGGVMITASHNPANYNGLKIRTEHTVFGDDLVQIYEILSTGDLVERRGTRVQHSALPNYFTSIVNRSKFNKKLKVVVDAGNGASGLVVPEILRRLGLDVVELFCDPDGNFPHRDPDPTLLGATSSLAQKVIIENADIGLAFDGDGDRVVIVDEKGQAILGDVILMLVAESMLKDNRVNKIVYEVLCSHVIPDFVASKGGIPIPAPSGYAFVHNVMLDSDSSLGGELSGHFFLLDNVFRFDDSVRASCEVLSLLSEQNFPLSTLVSKLPRYFSSREYRLDCPDEVKGDIVESVKEHYLGKGYTIQEVDGCSVSFPNAWALVRQSNTQPKLSLRFESKISEDHMNQVKKEVLTLVESKYDLYELNWPENIEE
ncbi:MAG: phosphomannomutase/phosphoglucomutase [Anaerolineales bacterium]|nr:phosphomannomutase/phosphoglucomutase [Anaerolineales bacterium]